MISAERARRERRYSIHINTNGQLREPVLALLEHVRRRYVRLYKRFLAEHRCPLPCQALSATCFLDPTGDLYPCIVYRMTLANVRNLTGDFRELWASPAARALH